MGENQLIQILDEGDRTALETFLRPHRASSLFLLSNLQMAGLVDQGLRYQGTYAAVVEANGEITGVAAQYWNGNVIFQTPPEMAGVLARSALVASPRPLKGLIGPAAQVAAARADLAIPETRIQLDSSEKLYRLSLDQVQIPDPLARGRLRARRLEAADVALATGWRAAFSVESLGEADNENLRLRSRAMVENALEHGLTWLLEDESGRPVSTTSFNATTSEAVQVGGVWTPPEFRSRGYGRAVVAASLLHAREEGVEEAILFTDEANIPAQRAYEALGFQQIGDYRLLFLRKPLRADEIL